MNRAPPSDAFLKLQQYVQDEESLVLLGFDGAKPLGYLLLIGEGDKFRVEDIYVVPEARGQGNSTLLMTTFRDLHQPGYVELPVDNLEMQDYFKRWGFLHEEELAKHVFLHYTPQ